MGTDKRQKRTIETATFSDFPPPRIPFGFSAGDLLEAAQREVQRLMKEAKGDALQAVKLALKQLYETGQITTYDMECLEKVSDKVFALRKEETVGDKAVSEIGDIYYAMLADPRASGAAASGVSVVFAAARSRLPGTFVALTLMGMVAGFVLGAAAGNPFAGAAIGGVVGMIVSRCIPEDEDGDGGSED